MPQNEVRQPRVSPAQAARGTPVILAMVRPMNMAATAPARRFGATTLAATMEPTPKKAPWLNEVTTRAAIRLQYSGAMADSRLPRVKIPIRPISRVRRGTRPVVKVISGAPIRTPKA
ncbi:hypothetical protein D3C80_890150 [compost metagenome]